MTRRMLSLLALFLTPLALAGSPACAADDEAGFESLFDGKSLDGWDGNPDFWSVKDGVITGQTTADKPTKGNTFLIYRKGEVGDFEVVGRRHRDSFGRARQGAPHNVWSRPGSPDDSPLRGPTES